MITFWKDKINLSTPKYTPASWIILLIGFTSTLLIGILFSNQNKHEDILRLHYEADFLVRRILDRMKDYESALIETRAFLKNSDKIGRHHLEGYIKDTKIFERSPGLQGLGYTVMFKKGELNAYETSLRKEIPGFKVWPLGDRETYSAVTVLLPKDWRNKKAYGFDMYHEETRKRAMDEARDQNRAIMTDRVVLVQEDENKKLPGFLLYLPHFRGKNLAGYVYSPFRSIELFRAIFSEIEMVLDVEIYAGNSPVKKELYFDYITKKKNDKWLTTRLIKLFGKEIFLELHPGKNFLIASSPWKVAGVFLLGSVVTLFLFWFHLLLRRQMEAARIIAGENKRLLEKEKEHVMARDEFVSIASHELKTPLTSLKLQAQIMQRTISKDPSQLTPEKLESLVSQIDLQTTRLTRLVDDMLDISRIRTGILKINKEQVNLAEVIADVIERLRPQFIEKMGVPPQCDLEKNLIGQWDRFRLEQVMTNLFTNAIRYGKEKPINVKAYRDQDIVKVSVKDQGMGIAEENQRKIFMRFERAGMSASEVSGLGLGLFITKQIVEAHGGTIEVQSELEKGSTFTVSLPLSDKNKDT
jgi:signal transduction histidine kinase